MVSFYYGTVIHISYLQHPQVGPMMSLLTKWREALVDVINYNPRDLTLRAAHIFVTVVSTALGLRFVLKLFGANASNGFVDWVYEMSDVLLSPFRGIFPAHVFENQYVLEFSTLFAIVIYMLFGLLVMMLVDWLVPVVKTRR